MITVADCKTEKIFRCDGGLIGRQVAEVLPEGMSHCIKRSLHEGVGELALAEHLVAARRSPGAIPWVASRGRTGR
jgi:hypothetical protein